VASATRGNGLRRYVGLALVLAAREFPGAYRGNVTGALAAVAIPLAMLAVYSFVFSTLIPVRLDSVESGGSYTLFLFSGLIAWNLFADVVVRGPRLLTGSPNYVRRPQFPISLLVLAPCIAAFYRSLPWYAAFLAAHWLVHGELGWMLAVAPLVLVATAVITFGVTLLLASAGAVVRDLGDFIQPAVTLLFFLSPILYPSEKIESAAAWVLAVNPMAAVLDGMRDLTLAQVLPAPGTLLTMLATATGGLLLGLLAYRLVRETLADLI
jgi:lipopolysaccharide transport system permease protein